MRSLRRHQLARLSEQGWTALLDGAWDTQARECLAHWATHRLPLVVTRQPDYTLTNGWIALGLPAPACWGRRRLTLQVPHTAVLGLDDFPRLAEVQALLPPAARSPVRDLLCALDACHAEARAFGSYGWETISGLDHVRPGSDLDLSVRVDDVAHADAVAGSLQAFGTERLRLDGELLFGDGAAVAWREWIEWRTRHARALIVKHLDGVSLQHDTAWCGRTEPAELAG
ncbi:MULTISPECIES: malonate decarboxylase holo-[acyl-carrier-protein] synthase [unclassified Variovorax]|uniref:malonate decarboxylase holo-[acyl-carrier-protein] synthase n=1 Tax=unclassified Variovorax TaxID=663243 RepID=UPI0032E73ED2